MTKPARPAPKPSPGSWPPNGSGSKPAASDMKLGPRHRDIRAAADKARTELQRRGQARHRKNGRPSPTNLGRRPDGGASSKRISKLPNAPSLASTRPPSTPENPGRHSAQPEPNPSSAPEPDAGPTSKANPEVEPAPAKPEQDDRSARLDELLARADQAARHLAAQQAERQASSEYAARIEREAQAQPEAGRQAARPGIRPRSRCKDAVRARPRTSSLIQLSIQLEPIWHPAHPAALSAASSIH